MDMAVLVILQKILFRVTKKNIHFVLVTRRKYIYLSNTFSFNSYFYFIIKITLKITLHADVFRWYNYTYMYVGTNRTNKL